MHFVSYSKEQHTQKTPEDFANMIEDQLRKMMQSGDEYGELRIDIPEDLTPEEAAMFIEEIIKRFNDEEDDE